MRLHFQTHPVDLYAALAYTLVIGLALLFLGVGNLSGILLILFVPGYVVVAALFPGRTDLSWTARIALSAGLSLALVTLLVLLLNFVWAIAFESVVFTVALFCEVVSGVALVQRIRLPVERRLSATLVLPTARWASGDRWDRLIAIVLVASIAFAGATLGYALFGPRPVERFSEFYLLGPTGNATGYPNALARGQNGTVSIGVVNHEGSTVNYTVRVDLVGVRIVYNATSGYNETVELNRTAWSSFPVSLTNGANWTRRYTFSIADAGLWEVEFLLSKNGQLPSQELRLIIRVT